MLDGGGITREELRAILDTQSKATEQMVDIARALKEISSSQKELADKFANGIETSIASEVRKEICITQKTCKDTFIKILRDSTVVKILSVIVIILVIVSTFICIKSQTSSEGLSRVLKEEHKLMREILNRNE